MNKKQIVFLLIFLCSIIYAWKTDTEKNTPQQEIRNYLIQELEGIFKCLDAAKDNIEYQKKIIVLYHRSRKHYKHIEFFVEHYSPREAKYYINGALVPKFMEESEHPIVYPKGFQRIEELLFSDDFNKNKEELLTEFADLNKMLHHIYDYYVGVKINESLLLEICQLELFRIASMNLNGYDATISKTTIQEIDWCFDGLLKVLQSFHSKVEKNINAKIKLNQLANKIFSAKKYLKKNQDYDSFNRLVFIVDYINDINKDIVSFHNLCGLPWTINKQALNLNSEFLFSEKSFNLQYFSMYYYDTVNLKEQANLGKILFYDPILSSNNKRACASCHNSAKGFTDGLDKSIALDSEIKLSRNAPTLLNVIFQKAFFYDGRAYQLEQQIADVVHNKDEMGSDLNEVVKKLRLSNEYKSLFKKAFPYSSDSVITAYSIQKAITEYEKTLISLNSKFDNYLKGDKKVLNAREINGYNVFAGKALCGSCHFFPLFNGTVPPLYNESEYEVIGTPGTKQNQYLDEDIGRYVVTKVQEHNNAFKTPTVRNITLTAPYMHNGIYNTLEEVVEFYHKGGGAGFNYDVKNQTLPFDSLQLSKTEEEDIILFLKTLTDTTRKTQQPFTLPFFENTKLNNRVWGGEY